MTRKTSSATRPPRRLGRPSREEIALRQANLLRVAADQFVQHGYRDATMSQIAVAANLTKQTLYSWHGDKAALFVACIQDGARRFPLPTIDISMDVRTALSNYVVSLVQEMTTEYMRGFAGLLLRDRRDFPELDAAVDESAMNFLEEPLARFFVHHGVDAEEADEKAVLFLALALMPMHNNLLFGRALPSHEEISRHARSVVSLFTGGCAGLRLGLDN